jgi:hypothetical protein
MRIAELRLSCFVQMKVCVDGKGEFVVVDVDIDIEPHVRGERGKSGELGESASHNSIG